MSDGLTKSRSVAFAGVFSVAFVTAQTIPQIGPAGITGLPTVVLGPGNGGWSGPTLSPTALSLTPSLTPSNAPSTVSPSEPSTPSAESEPAEPVRDPEEVRLEQLVTENKAWLLEWITDWVAHNPIFLKQP